MNSLRMDRTSHHFIECKSDKVKKNQKTPEKTQKEHRKKFP